MFSWPYSVTTRTECLIGASKIAKLNADNGGYAEVGKGHSTVIGTEVLKIQTYSIHFIFIFSEQALSCLFKNAKYLQYKDIFFSARISKSSYQLYSVADGTIYFLKFISKLARNLD